MSCTRIKYMHHENIKKLCKNVQGLSLSETFGVFIFYFFHYIWLDIRIEICEREICLFRFFVCFAFWGFFPFDFEKLVNQWKTRTAPDQERLS